MPHSGGGGSHSGGSHSSSSSSGSSYSSSRDSSYSGPKYVRGQSRPYPGAIRFMYYHDGMEKYYYSDSILTRKDFKGRFDNLLMLGYVLIFCAMLITFNSTYYELWSHVNKLTLDGIDSQIYINDYANVIDDNEEYGLIEYLEKFRDDTGVVVSVVTYPNHNIGVAIEQEAYNEYVKMFYDEQHWLIYYVGNDKGRADDWEWNLMCGDDCLSALPSSQEDRFITDFHDNLLRDISFATAVKNSLNGLSPVEKSSLWILRAIILTTGVFIFQPSAWIGLILIIYSRAGIKRPLTDEQKAKMNATVRSTVYVKEDNIDISDKYSRRCEYCGNVVKDGVVKCPYCGADVKS